MQSTPFLAIHQPSCGCRVGVFAHRVRPRGHRWRANGGRVRPPYLLTIVVRPGLRRLCWVASFPMKSHTEYLTFNISARVGFVNITAQVEEAVAKSGVAEGLVLCNAMHITASVFINDNERGLLDDYRKWLEQLAPFDASPQRYAHNRTGEDNADAHMKRQIMGREVVVAITARKLDFGPWEQIFYGEFDGRHVFFCKADVERSERFSEAIAARR